MALSAAQIQKAYVTFFNRPADVAGLTYWNQSTLSETQMYNAFAASKEYTDLFTGKNSTTVVDTIYRNLFGHSPDVAGLTYWVLELDTGKQTVGSIASAIALGAQGADVTALNNKVTAATSFTGALDTTPEITAYANASATSLASVKAWLASVSNTAESLTAAQASLPATVAALVSDSIASSYVVQNLTTGADNLVGTGANDAFSAYVSGNADTLNSGDIINGSTGVDKLEAVLGSASDFAITPRTTSVEQVYIRSQATNNNGSQGENNVDGTTEDQNTIDAQDMIGVTQWHNVDSRADLVIEDVRILDNQITKDITIRMSNTDPGTVNSSAADRNDSHTDFEVYFSPESLRAESGTTTGAITVSVFSTLEVSRGFDAAKPLNDVPYDQLKFKVGGKEVTVAIDLKDVDTFDQFEVALKAALAANPDTKAVEVVRNVGANKFTSADSQLRFADTFTLTMKGTALEKTTVGWNATGGLPSDNGFNAKVDPGTPTTTNPLITSLIILDNVGRESESGDLLIGSMSTRTGVERFEITVENNSNTSGTPGQGINKATSDAAIGTSGNLTAPANAQSGSWLQHVGSTNNILREVTAKNDTVGIATPDYLYIGSGKDAAGNNLTTLRDAPTLLNTDGLTDVRLFDASAMTGNVKVGATITSEAIRKYQNLTDTDNSSGTSANADNVAILYATGSNNDSINLDVSGTVAGSRTLTGRADFTVSVDGGAGNDTIRLALTNDSTGDASNWYNNQDINNNITINGGDGNDVIMKPGAGDVNILGGAGNDTIYTDNTGDQMAARAGQQNATWVFNTRDNTVIAGSNNLEDLRSDVAATFNAVNAQVQVTFRGIQSVNVSIAGSVGSLANVAFTDMDINQAIKKAINDDAVLNKLLIAEDGPARTLVVRSLIDGQHVAGDFGVTLSTAAATAAQASLISNGSVSVFAPATVAATRYDSELGTISGVAQTGADSTSTSDNTVTGGAGDDVIVLGTTDGTLETPNSTYDESNEVLVYGTGFGKDTVVNFTVSGAGADVFDFSALGGTAVGANNVDKSILIQALAAGSPALDAAAVAAKFVDSATAQTHVYVSYDTNNVATVWSVADATGTGSTSVVATLQGTIDLADTNWASLGAGSFISSANAPAVVLNNGSVSSTPVVPGGGTAQTINVIAAGSVTETAATNTTFNVAAGNYTYSIAGFGAGDKLVMPTAGVATIINNDFTDGKVDVQYATGGTTTIVSLTGLAAATDGGIFDVATFNTAFGAGSLN